MSRPARPNQRSGDPRKRAAATPRETGKRTRVVVAAALASAGLLAVGLLALRPDGDEVDEEARDHARAACDLATRAAEAAEVDTNARIAASLFLLDRAIVESRRAAESAGEYAELDKVVQAVHTAAHRGEPAPYQAALDTTLATCRDQVG